MAGPDGRINPKVIDRSADLALLLTGGPGAVPAEANSLRPGLRVPFRDNFPQVVVQRPPNSPMRITEHPDYTAAKAGDTRAAMRVVDDAIDERAMAKLQKLIGDRRPTVVPVHAEEASGRNALPRVYAHELAGTLGLPVDNEIMQANRAFRTGEGAAYRMQNGAEFDGNVQPGADHLLADDAVTMGGTLADLHSHIAVGGGNVLGATTLMAGRFSHILAPTRTTLARLRDKLPQLEPWWKATYGHGFEGLTDSEAKYLTGFGSTDAVRDRIAAAARPPNGR
jgi:hypothetical protein